MGTIRRPPFEYPCSQGECEHWNRERRESLVFFHVSDTKSRKGIKRLPGAQRSKKGKGMASYYLTNWIFYIEHTHVDSWTTNWSFFWFRHVHMRKGTRLSQASKVSTPERRSLDLCISCLGEEGEERERRMMKGEGVVALVHNQQGDISKLKLKDESWALTVCTQPMTMYTSLNHCISHRVQV